MVECVVEEGFMNLLNKELIVLVEIVDKLIYVI